MWWVKPVNPVLQGYWKVLLCSMLTTRSIKHVYCVLKLIYTKVKYIGGAEMEACNLEAEVGKCWEY